MRQLTLPIVFIGVIFSLFVLFNIDSQTTRDQTPAEVLSSYVYSADLPDIELTALDGTATKLTQFASDAKLLTIWSADCKECLEALKLQQQYAHNNPELVVKTILIGASSFDVSSYLNKNNITLSTLRDPEAKLVSIFGPSSPTTLLVANNQVLMLFPGRIGATELDAVLTLYQ